MIGDRAGGTCDRSPDTWLTTAAPDRPIAVRDIHKLSNQVRHDGEPEPELRTKKHIGGRRRLNLLRMAGCCGHLGGEAFGNDWLTVRRVDALRRPCRPLFPDLG
jgi:hypothetical protein